MAIKEFKPTEWVNGQPPAITAEQLNRMETGILNATEAISEYQFTSGFPYSTKGFSDLELELTARYETARTGKIFATTHKKFAVDTSPMGTKLLDSVGLVCTPSTDTVQGQDDFMQYLPFQWEHCNYVRDEDDGFARPIALEGRQNYKTTGAVDVGCISATFWWKRVDTDDSFTIYMSDMPHPELALVPWVEAVKADGTVMPYYVASAYMSAIGEDGLLRSLPNRAPAYNQSHNSQITDYQKKGKGYWGCGDEYILHGIIFSEIKYGTANIQQYAQGCTGLNTQTKCSIGETGVKRVLSTSPWKGIYVGGCVSVGTATSSGSYDRGYASVHEKADRVLIKSMEQVEVDGTSYYAINLDTDTTFDTDTSTYVSSMPCYNGETDRVIDHYDGSYLSYTNSCHSFRLHGREYLQGQYFTSANVGLLMKDSNWHLMYAPKGMKHNIQLTGYTDAGTMLYNSGADYWCSDWACDMASGVAYPSSVGKSNVLGCGDRVYTGGANVAEGTKREKLGMGSLWNGSHAGLLFVDCFLGLGHGNWVLASRD